VSTSTTFDDENLRADPREEAVHADRVSCVTLHSERFRVGWVDTDASGRIHFTAAFRWVEATETALRRRLGLLDNGAGDWPRRHVEAEYKRALKFEDEIDVRVWVSNVGTTSVTFHWEVTCDGEVAIEGQHTAVQVDAEGRPAPLGDDLRSALG
jgi:acyl-CoA thioester hydrolase